MAIEGRSLLVMAAGGSLMGIVNFSRSCHGGGARDDGGGEDDNGHDEHGDDMMVMTMMIMVVIGISGGGVA